MSENFKQHKESSGQTLRYMAMIVAEEDNAKRASLMQGFMHWFEYLNAHAMMYAIQKDAREAWADKE